MQQLIKSQYNQEDLAATNTKDHIEVIEDLLQHAEKTLQKYKVEIEVLKNELNLMKQKITNNNESTKNTIIPDTEKLQRDLMLAISVQQDENNRQQAHIIQIKKETNQIQLLIIECLQRVAYLEEQVGNYK